MSPEVTYVVESLATIAVFGAVLFGATWGLRRVAGARPRGPLEILARQPLDARRSIFLVRVGKRVLVVGAADGALTRLGSTSLESVRAELEAETAPAARDDSTPEPARRSFRDALTRVLGQKDGRGR